MRQDDVDRVFRAHAARGGPSLPKGISPETTDLVLKALEDADAEGLSATECAESTGLSRSSTRRYLEHLVVDRDRGDAAPVRRGRTPRAPVPRALKDGGCPALGRGGAGAEGRRPVGRCLTSETKPGARG